MLDTPLAPPVLTLAILIKVLAYYFVVTIGLRRLRPESAGSPMTVAALVTARLVLGVLLSVPMWLVGGVVVEDLPYVDPYWIQLFATYFLVYGAFRWLLWSAIAALITPKARTIGAFLVGSSSVDRRWRFVGVLASFLCDVPIMFLAGGPIVGKFFC